MKNLVMRYSGKEIIYIYTILKVTSKYHIAIAKATLLLVSHLPILQYKGKTFPWLLAQ